MSNKLGLLFSLGRPFSPLYGAAMKIRERCYQVGILKQYTFSVPIISIGNLVLGGTGKTPTVQYIATFLKSKGYRPCVISRGYRGKANKSVNVVSDGKRLLLTPEDAGDEPYLLARSLEGVPVLTGKKRYLCCRKAIDEFGIDCIILDDGFQHLSVRRDIDIVLFDSSHLAGNSRIFPGGPLREPVSALQRCSCFLLTGKNSSNSERASKFKELLATRFPEKQLYYSEVSACIEDAKKTFKSNNLSSGNSFAFCGIANPERFHHTLATLGVTPLGYKDLADHVQYSQPLINSLVLEAKSLAANSLVTTEKDYVKLKNFDIDMELHVVKLTSTLPGTLKDQLLLDLGKAVKDPTKRS